MMVERITKPGTAASKGSELVLLSTAIEEFNRNTSRPYELTEKKALNVLGPKRVTRNSKMYFISRNTDLYQLVIEDLGTTVEKKQDGSEKRENKEYVAKILSSNNYIWLNDFSKSKLRLHKEKFEILKEYSENLNDLLDPITKKIDEDKFLEFMHSYIANVLTTSMLALTDYKEGPDDLSILDLLNATHDDSFNSF